MRKLLLTGLLAILWPDFAFGQERIEWDECRENTGATPTPADGIAQVYCKDNAGTTWLYWKDSTGTEHDLGAAGGAGAPTTSTYITQTPDAGLSAEQALSLFGGSAIMLSTGGTGVITQYAGVSCGANTWLTGLGATGIAASCVQPAYSNLSGTPTGTGYFHTTAGVLDAASDTVTLTSANDVAPNQGTTTTLLHGNAAGQASFAAVVSADLNITTSTCTNQFVTAISSGGVGTCTTDTLASAQHANQGTTTTLLHGNAAGNPAFGAVVSADMNITTSTCTNQFVTAISAGGVGTCTTDTLASAQHANQGTTTTVLHGNGLGNPAFSAVSMTADVTGVLPLANGGTNASAAASNGGVIYSDATKWLPSAVGTLAQGLYSAGAGTPVWADAPKVVRLTSDYTNATTSMTNTALTWTSPSAVSRSGFECTLMIHQSAATLGTQVDVNVTTTPTTISYMYRWNTSVGTPPSTAGAEKVVTTNTNATALGDTVGLTANTISHLSGVIVHTSTSTAVTVRGKASSAGTTTIVSGSYCSYYVL